MSGQRLLSNMWGLGKDEPDSKASHRSVPSLAQCAAAAFARGVATSSDLAGKLAQLEAFPRTHLEKVLAEMPWAGLLACWQYGVRAGKGPFLELITPDMLDAALLVEEKTVRQMFACEKDHPGLADPHLTLIDVFGKSDRLGRGYGRLFKLGLWGPEGTYFLAFDRHSRGVPLPGIAGDAPMQKPEPPARGPGAWAAGRQEPQPRQDVCSRRASTGDEEEGESKLDSRPSSAASLEGQEQYRAGSIESSSVHTEHRVAPIRKMMLFDGPNVVPTAAEFGRPSIVGDIKSFQANFHIFTDGLLDGLNFRNLLCGGGAVTGCLLPLPRASPTKGELKAWFSPQSPAGLSGSGLRYRGGADDGRAAQATRAGPLPRRAGRADRQQSPGAASRDVDLFVYGLDKGDASIKIRHVYDVIRANSDADPLVVVNGSAVTFYTGFPRRSIQVVTRLYKSPAEILQGFDIDACSVGFDGERVWATPRAMRAFNLRVNTIDITRRSLSYESRLYKYCRRGFAVVVPGLSRSEIDPRTYDHSMVIPSEFAAAKGLRRLLQLDIIYHESMPSSGTCKCLARFHERHVRYRMSDMQYDLEGWADADPYRHRESQQCFERRASSGTLTLRTVAMHSHCADDSYSRRSLRKQNRRWLADGTQDDELREEARERRAASNLSTYRIQKLSQQKDYEFVVLPWSRNFDAVGVHTYLSNLRFQHWGQVDLQQQIIEDLLDEGEDIDPNEWFVRLIDEDAPMLHFSFDIEEAMGGKRCMPDCDSCRDIGTHLKWIKRDAGRQLLTGSFHPLPASASEWEGQTRLPQEDLFKKFHRVSLAEIEPCTVETSIHLREAVEKVWPSLARLRALQWYTKGRPRLGNNWWARPREDPNQPPSWCEPGVVICKAATLAEVEHLKRVLLETLPLNTTVRVATEDFCMADFAPSQLTRSISTPIFKSIALLSTTGVVIRCQRCKKRLLAPNKCPKCRLVSYCNDTCRLRDELFHSEVCRVMAMNGGDQQQVGSSGETDWMGVKGLYSKVLDTSPFAAAPREEKSAPATGGVRPIPQRRLLSMPTPWVEVLGDESEQSYYYNSETRASTRVPPEGSRTPAPVVGTQQVPFRSTPMGRVDNALSISFMPEYSGKSHEELRFEDYDQISKARAAAATKAAWVARRVVAEQVASVALLAQGKREMEAKKAMRTAQTAQTVTQEAAKPAPATTTPSAPAQPQSGRPRVRVRIPRQAAPLKPASSAPKAVGASGGNLGGGSGFLFAGADVSVPWLGAPGVSGSSSDSPAPSAFNFGRSDGAAAGGLVGRTTSASGTGRGEGKDLPASPSLRIPFSFSFSSGLSPHRKAGSTSSSSSPFRFGSAPSSDASAKPGDFAASIAVSSSSSNGPVPAKSVSVSTKSAVATAFALGTEKHRDESGPKKGKAGADGGSAAGPGQSGTESATRETKEDAGFAASQQQRSVPLHELAATPRGPPTLLSGNSSNTLALPMDPRLFPTALFGTPTTAVSAESPLSSLNSSASPSSFTSLSSTSTRASPSPESASGLAGPSSLAFTSLISPGVWASATNLFAGGQGAFRFATGSNGSGSNQQLSEAANEVSSVSQQQDEPLSDEYYELAYAAVRRL